MTDWTAGKRKRVGVLVGLILVLAASFLTFDWTQYYFDLVRLSDPELLYSRFAKTATSFLIFLLALSVGEDGIDKQDPKRLRRAFVALFAGDLLFLLDEIDPFFDLVAVIVFLAGHVLIIVRNGQGLWAHLTQGRGTRGLPGEILMGVGIVVVTVLLFAFTLLEHLRGTPLLYILIVYALFLDLSLWTGWMSLRVGYFPKTNAILIAAGATCFFVGDYMVGFNLSLGPTMQRATTLFLTWVFYAPAIALLALSGYRWTTRAPGQNQQIQG